MPASDIAEARNHSRQHRQWTVPLPEFKRGTRTFDGLDRTRPATEFVPLPTGKITGEADRERLPPSTAARRNFGRKMRQQFYRRELARLADKPGNGDAGPDFLDGLTFADEFEDIVGDPPKETLLGQATRSPRRPAAPHSRLVSRGV